MADVYANLVVKYVYGEANEMLRSGVKHLLKNDRALEHLYEQLQLSRNMIDSNKQMLHPRVFLLENILAYANRE